MYPITINKNVHCEEKKTRESIHGKNIANSVHRNFIKKNSRTTQKNTISFGQLTNVVHPHLVNVVSL